MAPDRPEPEAPRTESEASRADRNVAELLQELRVAGLGVQVLFGFLLGLPFTSKFSELNHAQRDLYIADIVLAAVAAILLVGPVAYHRVIFRQHLKEYLVRTANLMAILGLVAVGLAISVTVLLVTSFVVPGAAAAVVSVLVFVLFVALWFALPLARRERSGERAESRR